MTPKAETHWILVRGLARESRHWGDFPVELRAALKTEGHAARIDCLDLPGTGRFSEMRSPVTIGEITAFAREKFLELRRRMREQGEVPPVKTYLVAISLGGMVACDWIERWPDDFAGVVLINTSFKGFSPFHRRLTKEALGKLFKIVRSKDTLEREKLTLAMISNRPDTYERIAREWAAIQETRPVNLENFVRQLSAAALYQPRLPKPRQPVLILNSSADRMVHPSCSEVIADRWGASLVKHPTAGHDLPLDESAFTSQEIVRWYESLQGLNPRRQASP
ncbi:MAG: alpha/beta fold hydrolase [Bdellovibrionota bacterium]